MLGFRPLPWEYAVRNLFRRPGRSALTLIALTLVVLLIFVVVAFIRGLEANLSISGDPQVVLIHAAGARENVENSSVPVGKVNDLRNSLRSVMLRTGPSGEPVKYASEELYLGTRVGVDDDGEKTFGLVRGVTPMALLVRRQVQILDGQWPDRGEVLVGRLAATKLGRSANELALGKTLRFEDKPGVKPWRISGTFASMGSSLESELWVNLQDLQSRLDRQDLSILALTLAPGATFADIDEVCKDRIVDLQVEATRETEYYDHLRTHYAPVLLVGWLFVVLVASAGAFAGLNAMYGAVVGRVRELSTLQTLGYSRRAIALSLMQEGMLLAATASLIAAVIAVFVLNGTAVRFTMGAFTLRVDAVAVLIGCGTGLALGVVGAIPPAIRAMRWTVAEGLKAV